MADLTRLRYVSSKNPDDIVSYLNELIPYKVEIKGNPTYAKGKWFLWFVLPEDCLKEKPYGEIDYVS